MSVPTVTFLVPLESMVSSPFFEHLVHLCDLSLPLPKATPIIVKNGQVHHETKYEPYPTAIIEWLLPTVSKTTVDMGHSYSKSVRTEIYNTSPKIWRRSPLYVHSTLANLTKQHRKLDTSNALVVKPTAASPKIQSSQWRSVEELTRSISNVGKLSWYEIGLALFKVEEVVRRGIWPTRLTRIESSSESLFTLMTTYYSRASDRYVNDPVSLSAMYLTLFSIAAIIDCNAMAPERGGSIYAQVPPYINISVLDRLLITTRDQFVHLTEVVAYFTELPKRPKGVTINDAPFGKSIFSTLEEGLPCQWAKVNLRLLMESEKISDIERASRHRDDIETAIRSQIQQLATKKLEYDAAPPPEYGKPSLRRSINKKIQAIKGTSHTVYEYRVPSDQVEANVYMFAKHIPAELRYARDSLALLAEACVDGSKIKNGSYQEIWDGTSHTGSNINENLWSRFRFIYSQLWFKGKWICFGSTLTDKSIIIETLKYCRGIALEWMEKLRGLLEEGLLANKLEEVKVYRVQLVYSSMCVILSYDGPSELSLLAVDTTLDLISALVYSQYTGTLIGFQSYLVLKELGNPMANDKIIIPNAAVVLVTSYTKERHQTTKSSLNLNSPPFYTYEIDKEFGYLRASDILPQLFSAYLHAVTSSVFTDPFTGQTGLESAMEALQRFQSNIPFTQECLDILKLIARVSPRRFQYPPNFTKPVLQTVEWNKMVHPMLLVVSSY
eukprot:gene4289-5008_t